MRFGCKSVSYSFSWESLQSFLSIWLGYPLNGRICKPFISVRGALPGAKCAVVCLSGNGTLLRKRQDPSHCARVFVLTPISSIADWGVILGHGQRVSGRWRAGVGASATKDSGVGARQTLLATTFTPDRSHTSCVADIIMGTS